MEEMSYMEPELHKDRQLKLTKGAQKYQHIKKEARRRDHGPDVKILNEDPTLIAFSRTPSSFLLGPAHFSHNPSINELDFSLTRARYLSTCTP